MSANAADYCVREIMKSQEKSLSNKGTSIKAEEEERKQIFGFSVNGVERD